jgi:hypothetical protein
MLLVYSQTPFPFRLFCLIFNAAYASQNDSSSFTLLTKPPFLVATAAGDTFSFSKILLPCPFPFLSLTLLPMAWLLLTAPFPLLQRQTPQQVPNCIRNFNEIKTDGNPNILQHWFYRGWHQC